MDRPRVRWQCAATRRKPRIQGNVFPSQQTLAIESLEDRRMLAPVPMLLKNLDAATLGSTPDQFVEFAGFGYFEAKGQLWRTDGTPQGTEQFGEWDHVEAITVWREELWFVRDADGLGLWKSDGSIQGTHQITVISSTSYSSSELTGTTRGLFFAAHQSGTGNELWTSDGTAEGTRLVKDIAPATSSSNPQKFVEIGHQVYFVANDGLSGFELWKTDGTESQTSLVRDLSPSIYATAPSKPVALGGAAYFAADGKLWMSDGTFPGTVELLRSGANQRTIVEMNGHVFFSGKDPVTNDVGLWTTDGQATYLVKDPNPAGNATLDSFFVMDGVLYFTANSAELWRSDGTPQGTYALGRIDTAANGWAKLTGILAGSDGKLLLTASNGEFGNELWRWDSAGPTLVRDIRPGELSSGIELLGRYNGLMVFSASDGTLGDELWVSDGTETGTRMLKDIETRPEPRRSEVDKYLDVSGITYFVAENSLYGTELWKTDGTPDGTVMVKDISPGFEDTKFLSLHNVNGTLMFFRYHAPDDYGDEERIEIWSSDGTEIGTQLAARLPYYDSGNPISDNLVVGNTLFFAFDYDFDDYLEPPGNELWKTDGTQEGTKLVKNIRTGSLPSDPGNFADFNGELYFTADDGTGPDLWKSDGTEAGTVLVKRLEPEFSDSSVYNMTRADGRVYFAMRDDNWRRSLWTSDGTTNGTLKLYEVESQDHEFKYPFATLGGRLIFSGPEIGSSHNSLMVSDGTLAGTYPIGPSAEQLTEVNGTWFFTDYDEGADEDVLWKTDGTVEGTKPASVAGFEVARPLWNANGTLLLLDSDSQVWATDGSMENVQLVDTEPWYGGYSAGEFSYYMPDYDWTRDAFVGPGPMVLRNATALVDLNGDPAGSSFVTQWAGAPVAIASVAATIESSQEVLTEIRVRLVHAVPGQILSADIAGTGIGATFDGVVLRLVGEDTRANYERVLRSIRFHATGEASRLASVDLEVQAFTAEGFAVVPVRTTIALHPAVVGRHVFYNHSSFDGGTTAADSLDDAAIATDKLAYRPGSGSATTASVTSYVHGINGIMVDIAGLQGALSIADLRFRTGTTNSPQDWLPAPEPTEIVVRPGAGVDGSDRVTIVWPDGVIRNTWLEVMVRGNDALGNYNETTGLAASEVFYFGNRIGDTFVGGPGSVAVTSSLDELHVRWNPAFGVSVTNPFDFNRDGIVSAADQVIARTHGGFLPLIDLESVPSLPLAMPSAATPSDTDRWAAIAFALASEGIVEPWGEPEPDEVTEWWSIRWLR